MYALQVCCHTHGAKFEFEIKVNPPIAVSTPDDAGMVARFSPQVPGSPADDVLIPASDDKEMYAIVGDGRWIICSGARLK